MQTLIVKTGSTVELYGESGVLRFFRLNSPSRLGECFVSGAQRIVPITRKNLTILVRRIGCDPTEAEVALSAR